MRRLGGTTGIPQAFAGLKAGYDAARPSRFRRTRNALGGSADAHYTEHQLWTIREYCRDMIRNDDVPGSLVDGACRNVIQEKGLILEAQTGDDALNLELWQRLEDWGNDPTKCDARGIHTFRSMQDIVLRSVITDGDIFALPLTSGQIQLIEADQCSSPTTANGRGVVCGIVHDQTTRRPRQYWFAKNPNPTMGGRRTINDYKKIPAFDDHDTPNVFHVFDPRRITQSRGIPAFAPVFDVLGMLEDIQFAALVQQQMVSCIAAFFTSDGGAVQLGTRDTRTAADGTTETTENLEPGMTVRLRPGEKVQGFSPNVPAPAYFDLSKSVIRRICARLGVPPEVAFFDTTDTTFHGYRGAVDQARLGFQITQRNIGDRFCSQVYRHKVRQWIPELTRNKRLRAMADSGEMFRHTWDMPGWRYVDPLKDAQADVVQLQNNLESPRGIAAMRGRDHDDVIAETIADHGTAIEAAIKRAQAIEKATGVEVSWRDILNRAAPQNLNISGDLAEAPEPPPQETPE